jgi:DNA processing protein
MRERNDSLLYWVWLSSLVSIPPLRRKQLLDLYEQPENLWRESAGNLTRLGFLTPAMISGLMDKEQRDNAVRSLEVLLKSGAGIVTLDDERYPDCLRNIADPPSVLYTWGDLGCVDTCVAVVGSRRATSYGLDMSELLSYQLSKCGITIVSGMARGIDSKAHQGAVKAEGRTIAVLGCGIDKIYPPENKRLMEKILVNGSVISEYLPGVLPHPYNFPARNRIISGMSVAVVVVEAGEGSGSLITVDFALEQGREVFAVPGNINCTNSIGTNRLIRDGAHIITSIDDILNELKMTNIAHNSHKGKINSAAAAGLEKDELYVLGRLTNMPKHVDEIAAECSMTSHLTGAVLIMLELKGLAEQLPGKRYKLLQKLHG